MLKFIYILVASTFIAACGPTSEIKKLPDCSTLSQHERSPGNNCDITTDRSK